MTLPILVPGDIDLARNRVLSIGGMHVATVASGPPTSGQWFAGDIVTDAAGNVWICTASGTPGTWARPGLFFDSTLSSPAASFTITVPAGGKTLRIIANGEFTAAATSAALNLRLNADAGNNYDQGYLEGTNATVAMVNTLAQPQAIIGLWPAASATTPGASGTAEITIHNYASTSLAKVIMGRTINPDGLAANFSIYQSANGWRSTAAITSVTLMTTNGANFSAGSRCTAYLDT